MPVAESGAARKVVLKSTYCSGWLALSWGATMRCTLDLILAAVEEEVGGS